MDVSTVPARLILRRDVFEGLVAEKQIEKRSEQEAAFGLTRRTISRLLAGTHQPTVATALRIADALGVPMSVLFERVEESS